MSSSRAATGSVRLVSAAGPLRVAVLAFPEAQILDVVGPAEVFSIANRLGAPGAERYAVQVVAPKAGPVVTSNGLAIVAQRGLAQPAGPLDTLVVAGGPGVAAARRNPELIDWIRRTAARTRRVASVCTGAFLLAEAGLLDGRRATTHWAAWDRLARRFPSVRVERDPIFVRDGNVFTSAGVTTGMDLALELVEQDFGRQVALTIARWLVLFLRRPGGQSQFSVQLTAQLAERRPLRDLQAFIADHLADDLSVPALAERARMSSRNFARAFRREVGATPAGYVEAQRVEGARRLLEATEQSVAEIAAACGFGSAETMHRAFQRSVRTTPGQYRRHFRGAPGRGAAAS
jgi:transcriptional regulator GlxA family with amidase domain